MYVNFTDNVKRKWCSKFLCMLFFKFKYTLQLSIFDYIYCYEWVSIFPILPEQIFGVASLSTWKVEQTTSHLVTNKTMKTLCSPIIFPCFQYKSPCFNFVRPQPLLFSSYPPRHLNISVHVENFFPLKICAQKCH